MGYECDARAGDTLRVIMGACARATGDAEKMRVGDQTFIWRLGPEQHDGSVVGTCYQLTPTSETTVATRRTGSFRIAPSGQLTAGPDWIRSLVA